MNIDYVHRPNRNSDLELVAGKHLVTFVSRRSLEKFERAWTEIETKDGPGEAEHMIDRLAARYGAKSIEPLEAFIDPHERWNRPWKEDITVTQGKFVKLNEKGKYQVATGPGAEIKVWMPLEDIEKLERHFHSEHPGAVFNMEDLQMKIRDTVFNSAQEHERSVERDQGRDKEEREKAEEPAPVRYYQPPEPEYDRDDRGDDR